mgnify:CR=1 FL=1
MPRWRAPQGPSTALVTRAGLERLKAELDDLWLTVEREDTGVEATYRIVGPDEIDAPKGWISIDSPLARAALGKRVDDEFEAALPAGPARFIVVAVRYEG